MNIDINIIRVVNVDIINYCYLIVCKDGDSALLVDPAWDFENIENKLNESQATLCGVLLTHHHQDHIHLASIFATKYNIPAFMSKVEIDYYHFRCPNLIAIESFTPFILNSIKVRPIFTPGHTKGGVSYLLEKNLFTGDTLFIEGCGICSESGGDASTMFDTLQILKKYILPNTIIYPGHSYGKPVGQLFQYLLEKNVYLHFTNKDEFIEFRTRPNQKNLFSFK